MDDTMTQSCAVQEESYHLAAPSLQGRVGCELRRLRLLELTANPPPLEHCLSAFQVSQDQE